MMYCAGLRFGLHYCHAENPGSGVLVFSELLGMAAFPHSWAFAAFFALDSPCHSGGKGMAQFKVRDLMINVVQEGQALQQECPLNSFCPNNTCGFTIILCLLPTNPCGGCTLNITVPCGPCSLGNTCGSIGPCTLGFSLAPGLRQAGDLGALKQELKRVLGEIEAQERALDDSLQPQTLADIELLEEKITLGLKELQSRKEQLQRDSLKKDK